MSDVGRKTWVVQQVERLTGESLEHPPRIVADTTNYMYIDRGEIIDLKGELYLVRGHEKEGRFGNR